MRLSPGGPAYHFGVSAVGSNSEPPLLVAHATPGTDGAWSEMIASTPAPFEELEGVLFGGSVVGEALVDIGVGASSSEQLLIEGLPLNTLGTSSATGSYRFRLPTPYVAKGSRIAARIHRASAASLEASLSLNGTIGGAKSIRGGRKLTTMGTVLANAAGTVLDPGATNNTEGTKVDITTNTPRLRRLWAVVVHSGTTTWSTFNSFGVVRVYLGASGSERLLLPPLAVYKHSSIDNMICVTQGPFDVDILKGSTLRGSFQVNLSSSSYRSVGITLFGAA